MSRCVEAPEQRRARPWLGTIVEITVRGDDESRLGPAIEAAFASVEKVHRLMSFFDPASDIFRFNLAKPETPILLHPWTSRVLCKAARLSAESGGIFDVTVAAKLVRQRFLPAHLSVEKCRGRWQDLVMHSDGSSSKTRPLIVDLGGIAKGFAVDQAIRRLQRFPGISAALINAGGDLRAFGPEAWPVGIRDAQSPGHIVAKLDLKNAAMASSGGYFRNRESGRRRISALIDGRTRRSLAASTGVSVVAPSALLADALTKIAAADLPTAQAMLKKHRAKAFWQGQDDLAADR